MKHPFRPLFAALAALMFGMALSATAGEAEIRKNLAARIPQFAKIDEVTKAPIPGLYEVRVNGFEIFYTDEQGNYLLQGNLIDVKERKNLTEERVEKLSQVAFDKLPGKDAIKIVRGNGSRKVAIFEDPNCGYCKRFERDLQGVTDITVYVLLYPILSPDSVTQSKAIWCSSDPGKTWLDHMVRDVAVSGSSTCATPVDKILALGQAKRVHGTPTIIFENGERIPGAIPISEIEKKFAQVKVAANAPAATAK